MYVDDTCQPSAATCVTEVSIIFTYRQNNLQGVFPTMIGYVTFLHHLLYIKVAKGEKANHN